MIIIIIIIIVNRHHYLFRLLPQSVAQDEL